MTDATKDTLLRGSLVMAGNSLRAIVSDVLFRAGDKEASAWLDVHPLETQGLFEAAVLAIREKKGIKPVAPINSAHVAQTILEANKNVRSHYWRIKERSASIEGMASALANLLDNFDQAVDDVTIRSHLTSSTRKSLMKALQKIGTVRAKGVQTPNMAAVYRMTTNLAEAVEVTVEAAVTVLAFGLKAADVNNADEAWAARSEGARRAEAAALRAAVMADLGRIRPFGLTGTGLPLATVSVTDIKAAATLARKLWANDVDKAFNLHSIVALPVTVGAHPETWVFAFSGQTRQELPPLRLAGHVAPAGFTGDGARSKLADVLQGADTVEPIVLNAAQAEVERLAGAWIRATHGGLAVWDARAPTSAKGRATLPARVVEGASEDAARYGLTGVGLSRDETAGDPWYVSTNGHMMLCAKADVFPVGALHPNAHLPGNLARACGPTLAVYGGGGSPNDLIVGTETTLYAGESGYAPDYWGVLPSAARNNHVLLRIDDVRRLVDVSSAVAGDDRPRPITLVIPSTESGQVPVFDMGGRNDQPNVSAASHKVHIAAGRYEAPKRVGLNPRYIADVSRYLLGMGAVACTWQIGHALGPIVVRGFDGHNGEILRAFAIIMPMRLD